MKVQDVQPNFIYPDIKEEHYKFGSSPLVGLPFRDDGDWRGYLPPEEDQNVRGVESSACYVEAQQHAIATIEEESLGETDNNYSARFNALLSNGTSQGGDPLAAADSIRHDGLVLETAMPFNIASWEEFHSWKGVIETTVRALGKADLMRKVRGNDIVYQRGDSLDEKYAKLKLALKYSPCPISVAGWYERNGLYYKPEFVRDNHLVLAVYVDPQNRIYIRDTYAPYLKILEPNYNSEFGMRWSVTKKTQEEQLSDMRSILLKILDWIYKQRQKFGSLFGL